MELFEFADSDLSVAAAAASGASALDDALQARWGSCAAAGVGRYLLEDLITRLVPGELALRINWNKRRFETRRAPPVISSIMEPFQETRFHFNKAPAAELLFRFKQHEHQLLFNVSPLAAGHSLLVPDAAQRRHQVLTEAALHLGMELLLLSARPDLCLAFNSLLAFASVNHQHLHCWYADAESGAAAVLAAQRLSLSVLAPAHDLYHMAAHPVPNFVFVLRRVADLACVVRRCFALVALCLERALPHNVFAARAVDAQSGEDVVRLVVWPRRESLDQPDAQFNIAVAELAGQVVVRERAVFDALSEADLVAAMARVALPDAVLTDLRAELLRRLADFE